MGHEYSYLVHRKHAANHPHPKFFPTPPYSIFHPNHSQQTPHSSPTNHIHKSTNRPQPPSEYHPRGYSSTLTNQSPSFEQISHPNKPLTTVRVKQTLNKNTREKSNVRRAPTAFSHDELSLFSSREKRVGGRKDDDSEGRVPSRYHTPSL